MPKWWNTATSGHTVLNYCSLLQTQLFYFINEAFYKMSMRKKISKYNIFQNILLLKALVIPCNIFCMKSLCTFEGDQNFLFHLANFLFRKKLFLEKKSFHFWKMQLWLKGATVKHTFTFYKVRQKQIFVMFVLNYIVCGTVICFGWLLFFKS